jgi:hypothetical protein
LDRLQAIAVLKELVNNDLVDPSYISVGKRQTNQYQIQIKCNYNRKEIEEYAKKYNLTIEEDKEQLYLLIFRP